jgi:hypothetical protein
VPPSRADTAGGARHDRRLLGAHHRRCRGDDVPGGCRRHCAGPRPVRRVRPATTSPPSP